jgi:2-hydroxychromene-2-carboxylate isomerase
MRKLEFYFDFLSPYSYLSWQWVKRKRAELFSKNIELEYTPVALSSIIGHYETKGPAQIEGKRNYLFKDCLRFSKLNNISFRTPKFLPFNSLYALRSSLKENIQELQFDLIDLVFTKGWNEGKDIGNPDLLMEFFLEKGWDAQRILNNVNSREMRKILKDNIKKAIQKNIFGVPSFVIDEELFWGNDSIPHLEKFILGEDTLDIQKFDIFLREHPFTE